MKEATIVKKIDEVGHLNAEIKNMQEKLKKLKDVLKEIAKNRNVKLLKGKEFDISFTDELKSIVDIDKLFTICNNDFGEAKQFLKVSVTDCRKLSVDDFESISDIEFFPYHKMIIKRKIKRKKLN